MKTPVLAIIIASIFLMKCKKEDKPDLNEKYYFKGTIENNPVSWEVKAVNNSNDTSRYQAKPYYYYGQWSVDCSTIDCYDIKAGTTMEKRNLGNSIQVLFLKATKTSDINQLKPFFSPGSKSYGNQRTSANTITNSGILIIYFENGRKWQSEIGDQTTSTFESIEFKEATIDKHIYSNVWRARFSCKVYFSGLPPKTLQNCEIYGPAFYK